MDEHKHEHSHEHGHSHRHSHSHPHSHEPSHDHAHEPEQPPQRHNHAHPSRRDFFARLLGRALGGVSILELAFNRAAWARALAATSDGPKLFDISKTAEGVFHAIARPRRMINSSSVIFVGSRDVLVVDSQAQPSVTASLINQIKKEVTPKPVRYVVNTHFHDDHVQGNSAYRTPGSKVDIIAHTATAELMTKEIKPRLQMLLDRAVPSQRERLGDMIGNAKTAEEKAFWQDQLAQLEAYNVEMKSFELELPTIKVDKSYVVKDGVHDLHVEFHGKAHTAGDVVVFCPQKRVVAAGDMILGGIPYMPDSYPKAWPRTIEAVCRLEWDKILTAHGPLLDRKRVFNQRDFMDEVNARVEEAKKAGLSREDTRKAITVDSLKSLQVDRYGEFMFGVRDSLFPHWRQTFLGQPPDPQGSLNGMVGTVYRRLDDEQKEAAGKA